MAPRNDSVPARRTTLSPEEVTRLQGRVLDANGNVWLGPGPVPSPTAPASELPRRMDFLPGWNIYRQPESGKSSESGLTFEILRAFSEQTIVRAAIETCKDDDEKVDYVFTLEPEPGERKTATAKRAANDPRLKEVVAFFRSPDKRNDFATWRRLAWEEILVADNLSLYWWAFEFPKVSPELDGLVRNNRPPYALRIIDGDTIQPLIDASGYEPTAPDPAFDQWIKGSPRKQFSSDLLLYAPFNPRVKKIYGYSPVEQLLFYIDIAIRRDITKRAHYTEGNIPAGMWQAPEEWTPQQIEQAQTWLDVYVGGNAAQRSKLLFMPGGKHPPVFPQDKALQDQFDEWLAMLTGWVFNVPVTSLIKQQNRATAETSKETATEGGRQARSLKMIRFINRVITWAFGPEYSDVVVTTRQQLETDPDIQSQIDDRGIKNGTIQIDEVREREGRESFNLPPGYIGPLGYTPFGAAPAQMGPDGQPLPQEEIDPAAAAAAAGEDPASVPGVREFNGAQVTSAKDIVIAVANGELPRDAGLGMIEAFFGKTPEEAERIMGSAGNPKVPTTPNPRPNQEPEPQQTPPPAPAQPPAEAAQDDDDAEKARRATLTKIDPKVSTLIRMTLRSENEQLQILMRPFYESGITLGAKNVASGAMMSIDSPAIRAFIASKENKIVSVNETTGDEILARIAELQNEGTSPEAISDAIREAFDLRDDQADLIARQEVGSAVNGGRFIQMEDDGIEEHEWFTTRDGRERESHAALDGEVRKIGERFSNGLEYPQDPAGDADEVIGCRCVTVPVVAEKARNDRAKRWRAARKGATSIERKMTSALHDYFMAQRDRLIAAVADL